MGKRCGDDIQGVAVPAWWKEAKLRLDRGRRGRLVDDRYEWKVRSCDFGGLNRGSSQVNAI